MWDLAQRVTSEEQLQSLGREVLQLSEEELDGRSTFQNQQKEDFKFTARELLKTWMKTQATQQEAYTTLFTALFKSGWTNMAEELRKLVTGIPTKKSKCEP